MRRATAVRPDARPEPAALPPDAVRPLVAVRGLHKTYRRGDGSIVKAVDGLDLDVHSEEIVVLLGPSGCGKTTLLRAIAGLEEPDAGTIEVRGRTVYSAVDRTWVPPERRGIGMMFQSYALWPHMTARDNVAYPLLGRGGMAKAEARSRAAELLTLVGIEEVVRQYPGQMSGGQQQRVALARALAAGEQLILFDEPLSNVDAKVREHLRLELLSMQRELGFTGVYVTHDQSEAMALASRVAVLRDGDIVQIGTPRDIYERPRTSYVADFVGDGTRLAGRVINRAGARVDIDTDVGRLTAECDPQVENGEAVEILARPQHWRLSVDEPATLNRLRGKVERVLFLGATVQHIVRVGDQQLLVHHTEHWPIDEGSNVWLSVEPSQLWVLESQ